MEQEPYFFLSYARRDDRDAFVGRFYDDLVAELERIGADSTAQAPFRDVERLGLGANWGQALGAAVGHCRALVALYSPSYLRSAYCGKEWTAFRNRLLRYRVETEIDVPALVPVLWSPLQESLPEEVGRLQYLEPRMGREYAEHGLMRLLRTDPMGEEYRTVVRVIAERVRYAADLFRLPKAPALDLDTVPGCFPVEQRTEPGQGSGHVLVLLAAGVADPLPDGRSSGRYYGSSPKEWTPYHPPARPTIANRAQRVIVEEGHTTGLEVVGPQLGSRLDQAMSNNQTSILLVDAWAARTEPYRVPLTDYDRQNHPVTGVLVPCHDADDESGSEALWDDVHEVFQRNWMRRNDPYDPLFRVRVSNDDFDERLAVMVTVAQNRLMENATPRRLPSGPPAPPMPGLAVPGPPPLPGPGHRGAPDPLGGPPSRKDEADGS